MAVNIIFSFVRAFVVMIIFLIILDLKSPWCESTVEQWHRRRLILINLLHSMFSRGWRNFQVGSITRIYLNPSASAYLENQTGPLIFFVLIVGGYFSTARISPTVLTLKKLAKSWVQYWHEVGPSFIKNCGRFIMISSKRLILS